MVQLTAHVHDHVTSD